VKREKLFEQFPPVNSREWMDKITVDLKGDDFNSRMVWKTGEGFDVMPFYRTGDLENLNHVDKILPLMQKWVANKPGDHKEIRILHNRWLIRQNIRTNDYNSAHRKALELIMKGVDSLGFIIKDPESVNEGNFEKLLKGIDPEYTEINFISEGRAREIISALINITEKNGIDRSSIRGAVEADPLGRLMMKGVLCIPVDAGFDYLASLVRETAFFPNFRAIQINGSNFCNVGAGAVKELALSISMGVEYLTQLTDRGLDAGEICSRIRFGFGIGTDYFMEIAKLRAARILWAIITDAFKDSERNSFRMEIHSVTKIRSDSDRDPFLNMIRTQTEAMSAITGGTDSLTVDPFDINNNFPGEFSERIARNQQLILKEEAWFDKVADPSAGSYYIENLTALIAENSWKLFLEIENSGGFIKALNSGLVHQISPGLTGIG
jgi:methylmalonyl-CoA mutase